MMQQTLQTQKHPLQPTISNNLLDIDDQQGQDLFNQIELDQQPAPIKQSQQFLREESPILLQKKDNQPKKLKKALQLDSDESQKQIMRTPKQKSKKDKSKSDKKKRKLQKKLRKKLKKQKRNNEHNLKRLRKQGDQQKKSQDWSGQSSQSFQQDSDVSSDSLLGNLKPQKTKKAKVKSTEKKEGFSLKQLGNDAQINFNNDEQIEDDDSQSGKNGRKKGRKTKPQKKQIVKNLDMLKKLLQNGLCVEEQNEQNKQKSDYQYDNGLQQIDKLKGGKKKGPKILNKLFGDLEINQQQVANNTQKFNHKEIELQIKPKVNNGPSFLSRSFLSKAQRIKKVRGMQSEMLNQQYQQIVSKKAQESMIKLISQKQVEQAEDIQLDVKVPELIRGNEQMNNSIFLKKISSTTSNKGMILQKNPTPKKPEQKNLRVQNPKAKISRIQFFRTITQDVKARRSKQFTNDLLKNNFRITQLEQIQQMRKRNEEKKKRQILAGSDYEDDEEQQENKDEQKNAQIMVKQSNLEFMNFRVQVQDTGKPNKQIVEQKQQMKQNDRKKEQYQAKSFAIQIRKSVPDDEYKKLLREEQGLQLEQEQQQVEESGEDNKNQDAQIQQQNGIDIEQQNELEERQKHQDDQINHLENEQLQKVASQAEPVEVEVDIQVSNLDNQQQQDISEDDDASAKQGQDGSNQQPIHEQYQQYLNSLQADGIQLKRRAKVNKQKNNNITDTKQNMQSLQNRLNPQQNQARRQFRKLRKLATILKQKKIIETKIKKAGEFFDEEAEQGSDNQDHDNEVKKINYDEEAKQYQGLDLDADLQELIDNAVNINEEDQQEAFRKYMEDIKLQDKQQLKRIMNGDFKRRREADPIIQQLDEQEKLRNKRMEQFQEYLKKQDIEEGKELYMEDQNQNNNSDDNVSENPKANNAKNMKNANQPEEQNMEMVDQLNEENLKRYFDQGVADSFKTKAVVPRPVIQIAQSFKREKKTAMRNTIKAKEPSSEAPVKLKKTSSHLNELLMKNKEKIKPLIALKSFSGFGKR